MKGFIFTLCTLILIIALGAGGYFAIKSMTKPASYIPKTIETIGDLHAVVTDPDTGTSPVQTPVTTAPAVAAPVATASVSSTSTSLSTNLSSMISNKILLKLGNKGTNVGYVEQFMNLYLKKNLVIDDTFDKILKANIITFQKQNKIAQTGTVGPTTLQTMVLWLKNNPQ